MELLERVIQIPSRTTKIKVYMFYDQHIGSYGFDEKLFRKHRNIILNDPFAYCILGGDLAECICKGDKRYNPRGIHPMFHDAMNNNNLVGAQYSYAKKEIKPLADEKKILAYVRGNHEDKFALRTDYDFVGQMCGELDIPYGGINLVHALKMKRGKSASVRVCLTNAIHGKRGGSTTASKVTACERQAIRVRGCHVYVRGHGHVKFTLPGERVGVKYDKFGLVEYAEPEAKGSSGAYCRILKEGGESYAEEGEYQPTDLGMIYAEIQPFAPDGHDKDKMTVNLINLV
jgi:hypothetical protein